ncbi:hypothetical protein HHK36_019522 [Tetracentron sinense]|uniref:Uncharacterized protein n=1 Tax=Tetracentron sinense TaxID=13715 RepID=A0A834Z2C8_TETSI|nr:hypothetical protein HHK36_019522 [Tetracentron sinense]
MRNPRTLCVNPNLFSEAIMKIIKMGFDPSSLMFAHGLRRLLGINKGIWEAKLAVYRSFGWSNAKILSLFRKLPMCMGALEKKISIALDFFMNKLNWTPVDISKYPTPLFLSLEKRTMPRCSVFEVLSKGLMKKAGMGKALKVSEDVFLKKYVVKYEELPQLLKVYQTKMGVLLSPESALRAAQYLTTLLLSLEKRTMPRCSVIEVLFSKGLMKKGQMGNALMKAEDVFLKNYVIKYEEDLPQLLMIYQSKMGVL